VYILFSQTDNGCPTAHKERQELKKKNRVRLKECLRKEEGICGKEN
jgi:hypothetical protein